ncbi:hypothetical protein FXB78_09875 [Aggregatibacter actinomycetemcomitans]|nr:hypothetical protein FXN58_00755 [Aggregatibacter actinomycetemcomitans]QEH46799.1 hypothetical protein FXN59_03325 [Aggregatibacter actinomycetemcomitans]QEH48386.1 hypothetical protein FXN57_00745 [Aggregatibacter actinomycetemcomitans]TYA48933.1 hypothetical protein FXB74_07030 [Aggregatibacter actinomycetemcomitans]TYA50392.1 hypothetical protein FXB81_09880 [Aggregatibacter actinomycetemcomitans]
MVFTFMYLMLNWVLREVRKQDPLSKDMSTVSRPVMLSGLGQIQNVILSIKSHYSTPTINKVQRIL